MGNTTPMISAVAAALLSVGEARAHVNEADSRVPDVVSMTPVRVSLAAKELIDDKLRAIEAGARIRMAESTPPNTRYQRYRQNRGGAGGPQADDKTPFEKAPSGFDKAPGAFSNFSMPDPRAQDRVINPGIQQQQMQRLRNMQQNRLKIQPYDVQAAFELFRES
jgi:hypothetical protein